MIGWSENLSTNERATGKLLKEISMKIMQNIFVVLRFSDFLHANKLKITFAAISLAVA